MKHEDVWAAIDTLARKYGFSASGLAKKAGLDGTSFNKSKRTRPGGKLRWPSMGSISKILAATGASLDEFVSYLGASGGTALPCGNVPMVGMARAVAGECLDDAGCPVGTEWDEIPFPSVVGDNTYALEVNGHDASPVFRDGDLIIVSPGAALRRGDRVVVRVRNGTLLVREFRYRTAQNLNLRLLNGDREDHLFDRTEIDWVARIMWAGQ